MFQRNLFLALMLLLYFKTPLIPVSTTTGVQLSHQRNQAKLNRPIPPPAVNTAADPQATIPKEKYTINTAIDYELHTVTVEEIILYPNLTGQELNSLVLAVTPNLWSDCFTFTSLKINQTESDYNLNGNRLEVPLQTALPPDFVTELTLRFSLALPYNDQFNTVNARVFGYSDVQMNLINWYPFIVPFIDGQWILHDASYYGDNLVYPLADYEVYVVFPKQDEAPVVASSGEAENIGAITRYTLEDGRAFAFSISPDFSVSTMKAGDITVYSYSLPKYQKSAKAAMQTSAQALEFYSSQFGPYPHKTLSIVQADLSDSREFSGLFFMSRNFYQLYDGTQENYLTFTSLHATAHQWWFDEIANDQAMEPWLDEGLATWAESFYLESSNPDALSYWWTNRVDFFRPEGKVDSSIYDGQGFDGYKQAVFFNGAHFIHDLRERIGEETFSAFLQDYAAQNQGQIVTGADFFRILNEHTSVDYSDLLEEYFQTK